VLFSFLPKKASLVSQKLLNRIEERFLTFSAEDKVVLLICHLADDNSVVASNEKKRKEKKRKEQFRSELRKNE
jgi:hypothetical protein